MATWNRRSQEFDGPLEAASAEDMSSEDPLSMAGMAVASSDALFVNALLAPRDFMEAPPPPPPPPPPVALHTVTMPSFAFVPMPPPRPIPFGSQPAPPAPPPPEWMDDEDAMEQSEDDSAPDEVVDAAPDDDAAAEPVQNPESGIPIVSWTNVVATVNMGCAIPLKELMTRAKGVEWRPAKFPAVVMRRTDPKATCLIFASGKCVVTGPQTIKESQAACRRFVAAVAKAGYSATYSNYAVVNLSAMFECPFQINLASLAAALGDRCKYNPDRYPGLTYKVVGANQKATLTVFATGKVVLVGCASAAAAINATTTVYPLLVPHACAGTSAGGNANARKKSTSRKGSRSR